MESFGSARLTESTTAAASDSELASIDDARLAPSPANEESKKNGSFTKLKNTASTIKTLASLQLDIQRKQQHQRTKTRTPQAMMGVAMREDSVEPPKRGRVSHCFLWCKHTLNPFRFIKRSGLDVAHGFADLERDDAARMRMLALSRDTDLVFGSEMFDPTALLSTVLPSLMVAPPTLLSVCSYAVGCSLARTGVLEFARDDFDTNALTGASVLVSFLIAFYLGYCYDRYYRIYSACMDCRNHVMECCALARLYLYDPSDVWRIWRYTNLAHVTAMIGLSPCYTVDNLFHDFVREQELFSFDENGEPSEEGGHARELQLLLGSNIESTGLRASQMCLAWSLAVVSEARRNGQLEKPEGVTLGDKLLMLEADVYSLFNYQYQVMPWNYVHLISSVTTLYLTAFAFHQGLSFHPETTFLHGLVIPLLNMLILTMACVGLLIVGSSLANPLGSDTVDFAILTFLRSGAVNSKRIIDDQDQWCTEIGDEFLDPNVDPAGYAPAPPEGGAGAPAAAVGTSPQFHRGPGGRRASCTPGLVRFAARASSPSQGESTSAQKPSLHRPRTFQSSMLDSYEGALGGCASALRRVAQKAPPRQRRGSSTGGLSSERLHATSEFSSGSVMSAGGGSSRAGGSNRPGSPVTC